jgi:UDP-glucuronate 4-epimerase
MVGKIRVLITGTAGVIGYHVAERFLARGDTGLGVDNPNSLGTGGSSGDRADQ